MTITAKTAHINVAIRSSACARASSSPTCKHSFLLRVRQNNIGAGNITPAVWNTWCSRWIAPDLALTPILKILRKSFVPAFTPPTFEQIRLLPELSVAVKRKSNLLLKSYPQMLELESRPFVIVGYGPGPETKDQTVLEIVPSESLAEAPTTGLLILPCNNLIITSVNGRGNIGGGRNSSGKYWAGPASAAHFAWIGGTREYCILIQELEDNPKYCPQNSTPYHAGDRHKYSRHSGANCTQLVLVSVVPPELIIQGASSIVSITADIIAGGNWKTHCHIRPRPQLLFSFDSVIVPRFADELFISAALTEYVPAVVKVRRSGSSTDTIGNQNP